MDSVSSFVSLVERDGPRPRSEERSRQTAPKLRLPLLVSPLSSSNSLFFSTSSLPPSLQTSPSPAPLEPPPPTSPPCSRTDPGWGARPTRISPTPPPGSAAPSTRPSSIKPSKRRCARQSPSQCLKPELCRDWRCSRRERSDSGWRCGFFLHFLALPLGKFPLVMILPPFSLVFSFSLGLT